MTENGWREIMVQLSQNNEFEFAVSRERTKAVSLVDSFQIRFGQDAFRKDSDNTSFAPGDQIEVSPDSWTVMEQVSKWVSKHQGAAMIVDYGQGDHTPVDTLRVMSVCVRLQQYLRRMN
jgi:SAM-dependent MidA family methyltransferase